METTIKTKNELLNEALMLGIHTQTEIDGFNLFPEKSFDEYVRPALVGKIAKKHAERVSEGYVAINDHFGTSVKFREKLVKTMTDYKITKITCELVNGEIVVKQSISVGKPIKTGERAQHSGKWEFTNGVLTFPSLRSMMLHYDETKDGIGGKPICSHLRDHIKFTEWTVRNVETDETEKFDVWAMEKYLVRQS